MTELFLFDDAIRGEGFGVFCGVDEAGRGPLAGPVFAAAVILSPGVTFDGLDDSKKLSAKKRELLAPVIIARCAGYAVASATVAEIGELNILGATMLAMSRAIAALPAAPELALIDGGFCRGIGFPCRTIVKGDAKSASIAAASVLAKTFRDAHMRKLAESYPQYGFERHSGYGTAAHYEALSKYGPCPEHRARFLRKLRHE